VRRAEVTARQRGYDAKELAQLLGNGDLNLGKARIETFPPER
jgi:hypothetical protein